MKLFGYYRSSTSYRLRIALELKGLSFENVPVDLVKTEQKDTNFTARNPFGSVPMLEADGRDRAQSMALIEWLDEAYPETPLLPADIEDRYTVRELTYAIATELHAPLNPPLLNHLREELDADQDAVLKWYHTWLDRTLIPVEAKLAALNTGDFLLDKPGLFETVLLPQIYNARRFKYNPSALPHILRIEDACLSLPAFQRAFPDNQPTSPDYSGPKGD
ncbi:MAG: maleylacetoacetate isomerase [Erythrobacter sp.]